MGDADDHKQLVVLEVMMMTMMPMMLMTGVLKIMVFFRWVHLSFFFFRWVHLLPTKHSRPRLL